MRKVLQRFLGPSCLHGVQKKEASGLAIGPGLTNPRVASDLRHRSAKFTGTPIAWRSGPLVHESLAARDDSDSRANRPLRYGPWCVRPHSNSKRKSFHKLRRKIASDETMRRFFAISSRRRDLAPITHPSKPVGPELARTQSPNPHPELHSTDPSSVFCFSAEDPNAPVCAIRVAKTTTMTMAIAMT